MPSGYLNPLFVTNNNAKRQNELSELFKQFKAKELILKDKAKRIELLNDVLAKCKELRYSIKKDKEGYFLLSMYISLIARLFKDNELSITQIAEVKNYAEYNYQYFKDYNDKKLFMNAKLISILLMEGIGSYSKDSTLSEANLNTINNHLKNFIERQTILFKAVNLADKGRVSDINTILDDVANLINDYLYIKNCFKSFFNMSMNSAMDIIATFSTYLQEDLINDIFKNSISTHQITMTTQLNQKLYDLLDASIKLKSPKINTSAAYIAYCMAYANQADRSKLNNVMMDKFKEILKQLNIKNISFSGEAFKTLNKISIADITSNPGLITKAIQADSTTPKVNKKKSKKVKNTTSSSKTIAEKVQSEMGSMEVEIKQPVAEAAIKPDLKSFRVSNMSFLKYTSTGVSLRELLKNKKNLLRYYIRIEESSANYSKMYDNFINAIREWPNSKTLKQLELVSELYQALTKNLMDNFGIYLYEKIKLDYIKESLLTSVEIAWEDHRPYRTALIKLNEFGKRFDYQELNEQFNKVLTTLPKSKKFTEKQVHYEIAVEDINANFVAIQQSIISPTTKLHP